MIRRVTQPHRWRLCPAGQHWVRDHDRSNAKHGVHGYCRHNRSGKDQISELEIDEIAHRYFQNLKGLPIAKRLGFSQGNKFDHFIRGWTRYWNDVFQPHEPLDANLVKALIASESSFRTRNDSKNNPGVGRARGLMQITEQTLHILQDEHGELRDHFVHLDVDDLYNANQNICAGVRWLFRKRETASARLRRQASWTEAVADYKHYLREYLRNPHYRGMGVFLDHYGTLQK